MPPNVSLGQATRVWARIGLTSFGGPAGHIALMHRELVENRQWIDERRFLGLVNFCMLLPGPEAQQLATAIGWKMHGVKGGLIAGTLFVLPGFLAILGLSILYLSLGQAPLVEGLFLGLRAAVLAIVLHALVRLSRRMLHSWPMIAIAVAAFMAIAVAGFAFPILLVAAAAAGAALARWGMLPSTGQPADGAVAVSAFAAARSTAVVSSGTLLLWIGTLAGLWLLLGKDHVFTEIAMFFSKMALVTIGGAYAVLAWVGQEAVNGYGWISPQELIDGLALGETTPGPLILVVQFVAFMAGARGETGLSPIVAGTVASIIAVWVTFLPCFLWIFAGAPHADRLLSSPRLSGAMMAITAAVIGVMASLALWFAVNSLFGEQVPAAGIAFDLPVLATFRLPAALLSAAAIVAVFRWNTGTPLLLILCAGAGLGLRYLGLA